MEINNIESDPRSLVRGLCEVIPTTLGDYFFYDIVSVDLITDHSV